MVVTAADRRGLLRDIGDALARESINVTAVRTQSRDELAFMRFSFDVADAAQLKRALALVRSVKGVIRVARLIHETWVQAGLRPSWPDSSSRSFCSSCASAASPWSRVLHHRVADGVLEPRRAPKAKVRAARPRRAGARSRCGFRLPCRPHDGLRPRGGVRRRRAVGVRGSNHAEAARCRRSSLAAASSCSSRGRLPSPLRCTRTRCAEAPPPSGSASARDSRRS